MMFETRVLWLVAGMWWSPTATVAGELSVQPPALTASLAGHNVTLCCRSNLAVPVSWWFTPVASVVPRTLFVNGRSTDVSGKYVIISSASPEEQGYYNLSIISIQFADAGRYTCRENNGRAGSPFAETELTVLLNSNMTCVDNSSSFPGGIVVDGDVIDMECSFICAGNVQVEFDWTETGEQIADIENTTTVTVNNTSVRYVKSAISHVVNTRPASLGAIISCVVIISRPLTPDQMTETNTAIIYSWEFDKFDVGFPVRNIRVNTTADDVYNEGDTLTCSAEGSHGISFEWTDLETGEKSYGQELKLNFTRRRHVLQCTATNVVRNATFTASSGRLDVIVARPIFDVSLSDFGLVIFICVLSTPAAAVLFLVLGWRMYRIQQQRRENSIDSVTVNELKRGENRVYCALIHQTATLVTNIDTGNNNEYEEVIPPGDAAVEEDGHTTSRMWNWNTLRVPPRAY